MLRRRLAGALLALVALILAPDSSTLAQPREFDPQTLVGEWKGWAESEYDERTYPVYLSITSVADGTFTGVIHLAFKEVDVKNVIRDHPWPLIGADYADDVLSFPIADGLLLRLVLVGTTLRGQTPRWEFGPRLIVLRKVTS